MVNMERERSKTCSSFAVRIMDRADMDFAINWAATEGWNPGKNDADCFYGVDPNGFFLGELDGEPIGCISAVAYNISFGFIGFYIVKAEYRGKGYGICLWDAALAYMGSRSVGLDGVPAQQENYQKSGFKFAYRNIRYKGGDFGGEPASSSIVSLEEVPFAELVRYDSNLFFTSRPQFLKGWIKQPRCVALGIKKDNRLAGYGVIRKCQAGFKIGPLFADNDLLAEELLHALGKHALDAPVYLDVPEINRAAVFLANRHGMVKVFETARMYSKQVPELPVERIFGVTSFELG